MQSSICGWNLVHNSTQTKPVGVYSSSVVLVTDALPQWSSVSSYLTYWLAYLLLWKVLDLTRLEREAVLPMSLLFNLKLYWSCLKGEKWDQKMPRDTKCRKIRTRQSYVHSNLNLTSIFKLLWSWIIYEAPDCLDPICVGFVMDTRLESPTTRKRTFVESQVFQHGNLRYWPTEWYS